MAPVEIHAITSDGDDDRPRLVEGRAGGQFGRRVPGAGWAVVDAASAELLAVQRKARLASSAASGLASFVYDANEDGPWPRTDQQITTAIGDLLLTATTVGLTRPNGPQQSMPHVLTPPPTMTGPQAYTHGVWLAAYWTLDASPLTPMDRHEAVVTDEAVKGQARLADQLRRASQDTEAAAQFAAGVLGWLSWLVGVRDRIWPA